MTPDTSQIFDSYLPVFDAIPEDWDEAKTFLVERLKEISNAVNAREIGFFLDEELLSGKALFPTQASINNTTPQQFRQILRKVVDFGPLIIGLNQRPHGIVFDANFTLIQMWGSATRIVTPFAMPIPDGVFGSGINMDATNVNIVSTLVMDRCIAVLEYVQEI